MEDTKGNGLPTLMFRGCDRSHSRLASVSERLRLCFEGDALPFPGVCGLGGQKAKHARNMI
ncbi:hypothetical protein ASF26_11380 [Methylobacterium sp. Leaf93]|nr:hypothetical protein ASF26_11380 [Methylobacterium sp. Leaf93]